MKVIKSILSILFVCVIFGSQAQNVSRYTQSYLTNAIYNPAASAIKARVTGDLLYRNQWTGVDGAPTNFAGNLGYLLGDKFTVGANVVNDQIGVYQATDVQGTFAYRAIIDDESFVNFGLGLGVNIKNNSLTTVSTSIDQTAAMDPAFMVNASSTGFSSSFGIYAKIKQFQIGLGIPQMIQNNISGKDNGFNATLFHYYLNSCYDIKVTEDFTFQPNILFKFAANSPLQFDLNLRAIFLKQFGVTAGYRSENTLNFGVDYTILEKVRIGYSFNQDIGRISSYKGQSHEVYLGIGIPYYRDNDPFSKRKYTRNGGKFRRKIR